MDKFFEKHYNTIKHICGSLGFRLMVVALAKTGIPIVYVFLFIIGYIFVTISDYMRFFETFKLRKKEEE